MRALIALTVLLAMLATPAATLAGPPCLCWPFETDEPVPIEPHGDASSSQVVAAALENLTPKASLFLHMEILRRTALRSHDDAAARDALLSRLMQRALDGEAAGAPSALAWFDAAFAQAAFHQLGDRHLGSGQAWMSRAIALSDDDPRMHFAAALIALDAGGDLDGHQGAAERAEAEDALLARNLEMFRKNAGRKPVSTVKK